MSLLIFHVAYSRTVLNSAADKESSCHTPFSIFVSVVSSIAFVLTSMHLMNIFQLYIDLYYLSNARKRVIMFYTLLTLTFSTCLIEQYIHAYIYTLCIIASIKVRSVSKYLLVNPKLLSNLERNHLVSVGVGCVTMIR